MGDVYSIYLFIHLLIHPFIHGETVLHTCTQFQGNGTQTKEKMFVYAFALKEKPDCIIL